MNIEIGGGRNPYGHGYQVLDAKHGFLWGKTPIPYDTESIDNIYASHVIEHVEWYNVEYAIKEAYRVLKKDGTITIHTPDLDYLLDHFNREAVGDKWTGRGKNNEMNYWKWFNSRLFCLPDGNEGLGSFNWHRSTFNGKSLVEILLANGFVEAYKTDEIPIGHSPINLCVRGKK